MLVYRVPGGYLKSLAHSFQVQPLPASSTLWTSVFLWKTIFVPVSVFFTTIFWTPCLFLKFYFSVWVFCLPVHHLHATSVEARSGQQTAWNWNYRWW